MSNAVEKVEAAWQAYVSIATAEMIRDGDGRDVARFPEYTEEGTWVRSPADQTSRIVGEDYDHGNWSPGFWFGTRWLAGQLGGHDIDWEQVDARWPHLAARATDHTTHDLGFLFYPSAVMGSSLGLIDADRARCGVVAAEQLLRRYNPHGDYLQAFGPIGHHQTAGTSTMDTMMNLPLLWWAGSLPGHEVLTTVAKRHARSTARAFFRPDGSTCHLVRYDPTSGNVVWRGTFQGAVDSSCWSRGQAWGIAGFAWAYLATGEQEFRETAERAAAYFLGALRADALPPWDFAERDEPDVIPDASAAAIVALGLLILAEVDGDGDPAGTMRATALDLLGRCYDRAQNVDGSVEGLLRYGCYSIPHGKGIEGATAWGDFYYGLALALATNRLTVDQLDPRAAPDHVLGAK